VSAAARRVRTAVRAVLALVVVAFVLLAVEYAAQHPVVGVAVALALFGVYVLLGRGSRS
jgi:hypothetical protein